MKQKISTLPVDFYVTLVIMLGSVYFLIDGLYISKLNAVAIRMPGLVLGLTILLCIIEMVKILIRTFKGNSKPMVLFEDKRNFTIGLSIVVAYCIGLWLVGFLISTVVIGITYGLIYKYKKKFFMALYTVGVTLVIYGIFVKVLNVHLPQGLLFQWI